MHVDRSISADVVVRVLERALSLDIEASWREPESDVGTLKTELNGDGSLPLPPTA